MVNISKLKGKVVERNLTITGLAKEAGIPRVTLYRRFLSSEEFTVGEVDKISQVLRLNRDEINEIFFANEVA